MRARVSLLTIFAISIAFNWLTLFSPAIANAAADSRATYTWKTPTEIDVGGDVLSPGDGTTPGSGPAALQSGETASTSGRNYDGTIWYVPFNCYATIHLENVHLGDTSATVQTTQSDSGVTAYSHTPACSYSQVQSAFNGTVHLANASSVLHQPSAGNKTVAVQYYLADNSESVSCPSGSAIGDASKAKPQKITIKLTGPNGYKETHDATAAADCNTGTPVWEYDFTDASDGDYKACVSGSGITDQCETGTLTAQDNQLAITMNYPTTQPGGDPSGCDAGPAVTWFICGIVVDPLLKGINAIGGFLQTVLTVNPLTTQGPEYEVWKNVLALANVLFVLIFLIMIFATVFSLENYTVKKVLPRLVAAAILVQFSYFFSTILIDIGNVLGYGVQGLFGAIAGQGFVFKTSGAGSVTTTLVLAGVFVAAGIAAATIGAIALLVAVITILATVFTLLLRQVILVLLVVFSPLGIALSVLPSTEKYFRIWWTNFIKLILMFPLVMALFGAGEVFSKVAQFNLSGSNNWLSGVYQLIGYIMPLVLVPMTFKGAGSLMGFAAGAVSGFSGARSKQLQTSGMAKRLAENRQRRATLTATNPDAGFLRRGLARTRGGFGVRPSALGKMRMNAAGEKIRVDEAKAAEDALIRRGINAGSVDALVAVAQSGKTGAERTAALQMLGRTTGGRKALTSLQQDADFMGKHGNEWDQAMRANGAAINDNAPHLFSRNYGDGVSGYATKPAEQVAKLDAAGMTAYLTSVSRDTAEATFRAMAPRERQIVGSRFTADDSSLGRLHNDLRSILDSIDSSGGPGPTVGGGGGGGGTTGAPLPPTPTAPPPGPGWTQTGSGLWTPPPPGP